jgi:hypothetical protein
MTFPIALDSTMIAAFRSCPQRFFREYFEHWKPKLASVHLHAGGAYAKGLEIARRAYYEDGDSADDAIARGLQALITTYGDFECPPDSAKSCDRMAGALEYYFSIYPLDSDPAVPLTLPNGRRAIEFSFAIPVEIKHPDSGDPILYCGRSDMFVEWAGGIYGLDDKTTSSLGASWARQWALRSQFTGYTWAAKQCGIDASGMIVRGTSILKTKYDHAQAITYRAPFLIEKWYEQLHRDLTRMVVMYRNWKDSGRSDAWDSSLDHACTEYSGCIFTRVCESPDADTWLPMYFDKRVWSPLTREEKEAA